MSLTAVPVYFLARRVVPQGLALVAAVLAVAIPSMAYTSTLMTENAFYPAFALVALALVLVLERPTWRRQAVLLGLCAFAFLVRAQAVAFLPAVLTAPLLLAWMDGRRRRCSSTACSGARRSRRSCSSRSCRSRAGRRC